MGESGGLRAQRDKCRVTSRIRGPWRVRFTETEGRCRWRFSRVGRGRGECLVGTVLEEEVAMAARAEGKRHVHVFRSLCGQSPTPARGRVGSPSRVPCPRIPDPRTQGGSRRRRGGRARKLPAWPLRGRQLPGGSWPPRRPPPGRGSDSVRSPSPAGGFGVCDRKRTRRSGLHTRTRPTRPVSRRVHFPTNKVIFFFNEGRKSPNGWTVLTSS